eukprot:jgi/Botrbrau1/22182/Bobra.168_1s0014.1
MLAAASSRFCVDKLQYRLLVGSVAIVNPSNCLEAGFSSFLLQAAQDVFFSPGEASYRMLAFLPSFGPSCLPSFVFHETTINEEEGIFPPFLYSDVHLQWRHNPNLHWEKIEMRELFVYGKRIRLLELYIYTSIECGKRECPARYRGKRNCAVR